MAVVLPILRMLEKWFTGSTFLVACVFSLPGGNALDIVVLQPAMAGAIVVVSAEHESQVKWPSFDLYRLVADAE